MIIAVGCAPSSGSTFLADLLDSAPAAVCGPELNLFSTLIHYEDHRSLLDPRATSRTPAIYLRRQALIRDELARYGTSESALRDLVKGTSSFREFCEAFFESFAVLRGKTCTHYFEKTPQNIHCAREFLDTFEDGYFLHVVRDPLFVSKSLATRGYPEFIAAQTWLVDEAAMSALHDHPRVRKLRYEDLVKDPFGVTSNLLQSIDLDVSPEALEAGYESNLYRQQFCAKLSTWSIREYGKGGDANQKPMDERDERRLAAMQESRISAVYANEWVIPRSHFQELAATHGYARELEARENLQGIYDGQAARWIAARWMLTKYLADLKRLDVSLRSLSAYLRPTERAIARAPEAQKEGETSCVA